MLKVLHAIDVEYDDLLGGVPKECLAQESSRVGKYYYCLSRELRDDKEVFAAACAPYLRHRSPFVCRDIVRYAGESPRSDLEAMLELIAIAPKSAFYVEGNMQLRTEDGYCPEWQRYVANPEGDAEARAWVERNWAFLRRALQANL